MRNNLIFFENRIEKLEKIKQNEIDVFDSDQIDINNDNHDDDKKLNNHNDEIESQTSDFDNDDETFTKKRRINFNTLRNNVKKISTFNNVSNRITKSSYEIKKLRNKFFQKNNETLQLKIQLLKNRNVVAKHCKKHNDDYYRFKNENYRRNFKRVFKLEKFKQQIVINYSNFMN